MSTKPAELLVITDREFWWVFFNKDNLTWLAIYWNKKIHSCVLQLKSTTQAPGLPRTTLIFLTFDQLTWRNCFPNCCSWDHQIHLRVDYCSFESVGLLEFKYTLLCKNKFSRKWGIQAVYLNTLLFSHDTYCKVHQVWSAHNSTSQLNVG